MKIKTIKFCSLFLYVLLIFQLVSAFPISFSNKNETLIVKDSDAITGLPNRFRDLTNLNISGSAQFTPSQIENIKNSINKLLNKDVIIAYVLMYLVLFVSQSTKFLC